MWLQEPQFNPKMLKVDMKNKLKMYYFALLLSYRVDTYVKQVGGCSTISNCCTVAG